MPKLDKGTSQKDAVNTPPSIFIGKSPLIPETCKTRNLYYWYYSVNSEIATVIWSVQLAIKRSVAF